MISFCSRLLPIIFGFGLAFANVGVVDKAQQSALNQTDNITEADIEKFATVMAQIQHYYINKTNYSDLFDNAIRGMLNNLDPHSAYLSKSDFLELNSKTVGNYGGIGIKIMPENGLIKVISPFDNTPASKANIAPGDIILKIDNVFVKDIGPNKAVDLLLGKPGTKVKVTIYKVSDKKPVTLSLTRELIKVDSVNSKLLANNVGYIRIATFGDNTAAEVKAGLSKMIKQSNNNLASLILDIRNNPGGTLTAAIAVSDLFLDASKLKDNKVIVSTSGRVADMNNVINATVGDIFHNKPIIVLINTGSASASEILASALAEHNRAITLGTKTFGKGSIQTLIPIGKDSAVKITTGLYYTPRGRAIQAKGVIPDVVVPYIKMPKQDLSQQSLESFIDESQLYKHLKNKPKTPIQPKYIGAENDSIAETDFQLYQAIKLLQGLVAMHD